MRRMLAGVASVALVASLSACSITVDSRPNRNSTTATTAPETPIPTPENDDEEFLSTVRADYPDLSGVSDDSLIEMTHAACEAAEAGATSEQLVESILRNTGNDFELAKSFAGAVGAGMAIYCPDALNNI